MNNKNPLKLKQKKITLSEGLKVEEILLPLVGFDEKRDTAKVKEGTNLITGQEVIPGVYSTVTGTIQQIEQHLIKGQIQSILRIKVADEDTVDPALKPQADVWEKPPQEFLATLNRANLGFPQNLDEIDTVIISAVDKEPTSIIYQHIFLDNQNSLPTGFKLIKHLTSANRIILVVPEFLKERATGLAAEDVVIISVDAVYPNGLPEIIVGNLNKKYQWESHVFLDIEKLVAAIRAIEQGEPFVEKMVTIINKDSEKNIMVRIGTPVKEVIGDDLQEFDKVIMGGPMMGHTIFDTETPINEFINSIYIQSKEDTIGYKNNQCMSCGKCVNVCPVYLDVNLICRYAEFSLFDKCQEMFIQACIECGLCAYHCPSGRALVQLIQLAKSEILKTHEGEEES